MITMNFRLATRADIARRITAETANLKDWRITNKHNRAMRQAARALTAGKGYLIATPAQIAASFGSDAIASDPTATDANRPNIWALQLNNLSKRITFVAI